MKDNVEELNCVVQTTLFGKEIEGLDVSMLKDKVVVNALSMQLEMGIDDENMETIKWASEALEQFADLKNPKE